MVRRPSPAAYRRAAITSSPVRGLQRTRQSCFVYGSGRRRDLPSFPTRRSSDLLPSPYRVWPRRRLRVGAGRVPGRCPRATRGRSEEHTSELQSRVELVCRLLLEKKKQAAERENPCEEITRLNEEQARRDSLTIS